jgi:hypothetical protein
MTDETMRQMPINELDYNLQLTDPKWGQEMNSGFMNRMGEKSKIEKIKEFLEKEIEEGRLTEETAQFYYDTFIEILKDDNDSMWAVLSFYSRDLRLANLSVWDGELAYCEQHLNFAGDCLQMGLKRSFLIVIKSVASKLELSQSKGGFLRKRMGTLTTENINSEEPKKKSFFGMKKEG